MKLKNYIQLAALFLCVSGHPLGSEHENNEPQSRLFLPSLHKKLKDGRRKASLFGQGLLSTSTGAVVGLSNIITTGDIQTPLTCFACKAAVEALRIQVNLENEEGVYSAIETTCELLKLQTKDVCQGIAKLFGPELIPLLNSTIEGLYICSWLLTKDCMDIELPDWEIPLPPVSNNTIHPWTAPPPNAPKIKVFHVTDSHFDRSYKEGARSICQEPLCCRVQNGMASGNEKGAGKWGDWKCDIPEITMDSMLEHAASTHPDIDYIIWTGDIPAHDIWNQSKETNLDIMRTTVAKVKRYFPNTPVYPAVGNHEAAPTDLFPYPEATKSAAWLYNELDKEWSAWLPPSTSATIRKGAFYTTVVKPGLRLVSLNTNYCYNRNWWLMINSTDPAGQLKWLVDILQESERNNEKVHIIGHVPPGQPDCLSTWRDNYYRIVSRFRNTAVNHFFGHTHKDEYEIYYDEETEKEPVGVGYISPSLTTFTDLNPGYRIFYVDGDHPATSRVVLDYENWILDLEQSNKLGVAKWSKSYSAKEEFGMSSLSPKDWEELHKKLKTDDSLLQRYYKRSNKDSPKVKTPCDSTCKNTILCNIRSCLKY